MRPISACPHLILQPRSGLLGPQKSKAVRPPARGREDAERHPRRPRRRRTAGPVRRGSSAPREDRTSVQALPRPGNSRGQVPESGRRQPTYLALAWRLQTPLRGPLLVNQRGTAKSDEFEAALLRNTRSAPTFRRSAVRLSWARQCTFPWNSWSYLRAGPRKDSAGPAGPWGLLSLCARRRLPPRRALGSLRGMRLQRLRRRAGRAASAEDPANHCGRLPRAEPGSGQAAGTRGAPPGPAG